MNRRSIITLVVIFGALFLGLLVFIGVMITAFSGEGLGAGKDSIGVVEVEGSIMESKEIIENLRRFERDDAIKAVVVRINSPGGAVAPSQEIFHAVRRLKGVKPVAISMGSLAASGGYYIACGADVIFANAGSMTGSIGVITQVFNIEGLVERIDLKVHTVKSGEFKDSGSPFRTFELADEAVFQQMVDDIHRQFVEDVADCREMGVDEASLYADGRVFTGRQAKANGLIDEIGTLQDTIDYLAKQVQLEDPPIVYPPEERGGVLGRVLQTALRSTVVEAREQTRPRVMYEYVGPQ